MPAEAQPTRRNLDMLAGGRFAWPVFAIWLPVTAGLGVLAAWLAIEVQFYARC